MKVRTKHFFHILTSLVFLTSSTLQISAATPQNDIYVDGTNIVMNVDSATFGADINVRGHTAGDAGTLKLNAVNFSNGAKDFNLYNGSRLDFSGISGPLDLSGVSIHYLFDEPGQGDYTVTSLPNPITMNEQHAVTGYDLFYKINSGLFNGFELAKDVHLKPVTPGTSVLKIQSMTTSESHILHLHDGMKIDWREIVNDIRLPDLSIIIHLDATPSTTFTLSTHFLLNDPGPTTHDVVISALKYQVGETTPVNLKSQFPFTRLGENGFSVKAAIEQAAVTGTVTLDPGADHDEEVTLTVAAEEVEEGESDPGNVDVTIEEVETFTANVNVGDGGNVTIGSSGSGDGSVTVTGDVDVSGSGSLTVTTNITFASL